MVRYICISLLLAVTLQAQTKNIESRQKELGTLRKEIEKLETEMKRKNQREKKTYELLEQYNRKTHLINKLINTLQDEEEQKTLFIENNENLLRALESQSGTLKNSYSKFLLGLYKQLQQPAWLVSVEPLTPLQKRLHFAALKKISPGSKAEVKRLDSVKLKTLTLQAVLVQTRHEKEAILQDKMKEEKYLQVQLQEKQQLLNKIKKDKNAIAEEIDTKKKAEQQIHSLIVKLIDQARRKAEAAEAAKRKELARRQTQKAEAKPDIVEKKSAPAEIPLAPSANFQGKLLSPVKHGSIIRRYGQSTNAKLKTVTINYGIDIKSSGENTVRASGDGEVSAIDWIPGYGTVIIVSHGKDLRTVYGRVSEVSVREGQKVHAGSTLGRISESLEGDILHFEVWNDRKSQNPESWIGRF